MKKYLYIIGISVFIIFGMFSCSGCEEGLSRGFDVNVDLDGDGDEGDISGQYNPNFKGKDIYVEVRAKCKGHGGSLCSCSLFKGYKVAGSNRFYGSCKNRINGHICGHSASAHGLP